MPAIDACRAYLLTLLILWAASGAVAQDRSGADWITFVLPPVRPGELKNMKTPVANTPGETVHTIPRANVRNLVLYTETGDGEIVFFLETGSTERPRAFYAGLVPLDVYEALVKCLD